MTSESPPRPPLLHVDTSHLDYATTTSQRPLTFSPSRGRSQSTPTSQPRHSEGFSTSTHPTRKSNINRRALNESRKLLAHLLEQLQNRPIPPSMFETFQMPMSNTTDKSFGAIVDTVRGVVKFKAAVSRTMTQTSTTAAPPELDVEDEETENTFSTDVTFDLLLQLREVLIVSVAQGWRIFSDSHSRDGVDSRFESFAKLSTPFRRSRSSFHTHGKRSRSPSPVPAQVQAPELLARCISVLSSVISEDCRFRISSPRPSKPPNALQALVLDVSQLLLHANDRDPPVISQIVFALVPAFSTFGAEMHTRLLTFVEQCIVQGVLADIQRMQGRSIASLTSNPDNDRFHIASPPVAIQIQAAQEDVIPGHAQERSRLHPFADFPNILSTNAPRQSPAMYYLASVVTPLLAAVLEAIDLVPTSNTRLQALHHLYKLLNSIVNSKVDSYLNFLEVVAFHTPKARHAAMTLLATFWPKALGHPVVSKPLPIARYPHLASIGTQREWLKDHPYTHQFVPWRFDTPLSTDCDGLIKHDCWCCSHNINGFGLFCPFCMSSVHLDCYDYQEGSHMFQYTAANDSNMQKIAMHRFSYVLSSRRDYEPAIISGERHSFRLVNLFNVSLCFLCRQPLWGCVAQGYKCSSCLRVVHAGCVSDASAATLTGCHSNTFDTSDVSVDWSVLRSSFLAQYRDALFSGEELKKLTYEEVSVLYAVFWTQLQLLINGLAMGSVVVNTKYGDQTNGITEFELHHAVRTYEERLTLGWLSPSLILSRYMEENRFDAFRHHLYFDWSSLVFITSVIKTPHDADHATSTNSPDLLQVLRPDVTPKSSYDTTSHSLEVISLTQVFDILADRFCLRVRAAARFLLSHLHHIGHFDRLDHHPLLFQGEDLRKQLLFRFPLPLGLDISTDVDTLVSAVEACLSDLNLSVNEVGFLLLSRKLSPDGMMSQYALHRLTRSVLSWITAEDDNLAIILRDYVARQQSLPGVRSFTDPPPWPPMLDVRPTPPGSRNNGGDYVASRRALLQRYGSGWLLASRKQDEKLYARMLYEFCAEMAAGGPVAETLSSQSQHEESRSKSMRDTLDGAIRIITKFVQCGVANGIFDDLLLHWLDDFFESKSMREPLPSFPRLFPEERQRSSTVAPSTLTVPDAKYTTTPDPWNALLGLASLEAEGLSRSLHGLCVLARSGVEISVSIFFQFASALSQFGNPSLSDSLLLVEAAYCSIYLKSMGRQDLQGMLSSIHSRLASQVLHSLRTRNNLEQVIRFIRQTLATCLLLYGCERNDLQSTGLILEDEISKLPSRRKLNARGSALVDPIIVDSQLMSVLERYIDANVDEVTRLVAKFLNMVVNDSPYLESYEVDNFILRNGRTLCACAWQFYDIQQPDIASIRTSFLLRVLVVDAQPFQILLQECFKEDLDWEARFLSVTRLFRIILDVASPTFVVEDRQWRFSVIDVFYYYFRAAWSDEKEEIRLAVDSWSQTLLPAHFDAISSCWNESLVNSPIAERVKLVSFLIQLRPHFPAWQVLSWEGIIENLLQDDYERKHGDDEDGPAAAHLSMYGLASFKNAVSKSDTDPDMSSLRVSLILLSLQMIADGIRIDITSLVKIKFFLVQILGFCDAAIVPTRNGHAYVDFAAIEHLPDTSLPCISELLNVLDAHHPFELAPSQFGGPYVSDENPTPLLVGSIFVDVTLAMIIYNRERLTTLPVLSVKCLLECLAVVIQKHDLESRPLRHLQSQLRRALKSNLGLLLEDTAYELRQLAMLVIQSSTRKWHTLMGNVLFDAVECVAKLIDMQNYQDQDPLVVQGRSYVETTVTKFSGFFNILCRRQLNPTFFGVLKHIMDWNAKQSSNLQESIREAVLRDTLARAGENEIDTFQVVLNNLSTYIEVVYHTDYSADLMKFVGLCLTMLVRRPFEWATDTFDPTPFLRIPAVLIQSNKSHSRDLLPYTETILRSCLVKFHVPTASLSQLLHSVSPVLRKAGHNPTAQPLFGNLVTAVYEILADGLRVKTRLIPATLTCILETLTTPDGTGTILSSPIFQDSSLAFNGVQFLQNHAWSHGKEQDDLTVSLAVAKFVLELTYRNRLLLNNMLSTDQSTEKYSRQSVTLRTWNILALAALSESSEKWVSILIDQLQSFSSAFGSSVRLNEPTTTDVNHAYVAIKLWLLLAKRSSRAESLVDIAATSGAVRTGGGVELAVWNELWPVFEGLAIHFECDHHTGNLSTLTTLTCSSAANIFLLVRQLCSSLCLEISTKTTIVSRLRTLPRAENALIKLTRAMHGLSEAPVEVSLDKIANEAAKDIIATEKLQFLESQRGDGGRVYPERRPRAPT